MENYTLQWKDNFPPPMSGNYLVRINNKVPFIRRYDYHLDTNYWYYHGFRIYSMGDYSWWDEYGIVDQKKTIKLNLKI